MIPARPQPCSAQAQQAAPLAAAGVQSPARAQQDSGTITCTINSQTAPPLSASLTVARDFYRTGRFDDAIAAYNAILPKGDDEAAAAYAGLSRVYLKQKRLTEAADAASKALALTPNGAPAQVAEGEVLFRQGKVPDAERAFLAPLRACNLDARAYLGLVRLYIVNLDFKTADRYIRNAYRLDPTDPDIRREYIDTLDGQERIDFLKKYLADKTNDSADERRNMGIFLSLTEAEQKEGEHQCKLVNNVTQTETKMEMLLRDPQHLRGLALNVKVNGVGGRLMIDTGASDITIDRKIADKAGVKKIVEHAIGGIGDSEGSSGYLGYADKIQIGELEFQSCYVFVVNKRSVLDDDGLIGANVFRHYLVDLNMPDRKVKLTQLPPFPDEPASGTASLVTSSSGHRVRHDRYVPPEFKDYSPFMLFGHNMLIKTYVNNSPPTLFLIDTGSWDSMIDVTLARQVSKVSLDSDTTVTGLSGKVQKVYRTRDLTLRFSHFYQKRDDLTAFDLTGLSDNVETQVSGILGFTLFNMLDMKIDYRDGLVNFTYDSNRFH